MTGLAALLRPNRIKSFFRPSSVCSFKKFFRPSSGQMDELKSNPFYSKYAAKLDEIKRTRPKEFQQKVEELIKQKNLSSCKDCAGPNTNSEENVSSDIQKLKLESVMNMSLIENKTTDEIIETAEPITEKFLRLKAKFVSSANSKPKLSEHNQLKENAQTCLSVHHFTELAQSKGRLSA
ncbi:hypothetical protein HELRODRAFT_183341 [Helobdella robusta]|uniref:Uncharacterized protein n=1 Tax=Helobdella robusta TaxID=6412 RepID=T1FJH2_HELRO|nr:hypothetical protein HELRODRAFT_183341 [Helobdella robusta]ESO11326.1 hypothetical protein HELRODRAFT_183341 [Helobdella robusta]